MAAEYSRELSAKVFAGQCRLVQMGFHQGGSAGLGLRRALVDERREFKGLLIRGQHKSIQTDRVVLVGGPPEEVATVHRIYEAFLSQGKGEKEIANDLNQDGIPTDWDRPWTRGTVHQVLTNEKYIARIERELAALQLQTSAVEDSYGPDVLHLTVIKGYLAKWLGNAAVVRWLAKNRPEYLKEFQRITDTEDIASA
jgi:Recombinase/RepB plasmid partitioning protein